MSAPFAIFTASGPILGGVGYFLDWPWLFWIGVILAAANFLMNGLSGAMKLPIFPLLLIVVGALFLPPWYVGAALGLLAWTAIEAAGEILQFRPN